MKRFSAPHIDKFYKDSFILTLSNMVTSMIAFIFSIILSRELGAEGLGLYGLIMPVYGLFLCIASEGLITAISKISTLYFNRKDIKNLNRTLDSAFLFTALWAICIAFLVLVCNGFIALRIVRDVRASAAIMIFSPALIFVPLSAIIKGYFYGLGQYKITAFIDIVEKLLRVILLAGAISLLSAAGKARGALGIFGSDPSAGVSKTVAIAYFALSAGELASLILLFICYRIRKAHFKENNGSPKSRIQLLFDVYVISIPLCINGVLTSLISAASALLLPRRLVSAGFTYSGALSLIGRFSGMALNISTLPYIIVGSMLTVLVPELSLRISKKDYWSAEERIAQVLRIAAITGISTALVCLRIPGLLGLLLYHRSDLGGMIRFAAPVCLVLFISSPSFGILNALGKQNILLRNSLVNSLQNLTLMFIFTGIPALNIYGYGLSIILTSLTSLILNMKEIKKVCEIKISLGDITVFILSGVAAWLASAIALNLSEGAPPVIAAMVVAIACFGSVSGLSVMARRLGAES